MAKQKKKRSKKYTGQDAAVTRPVITRVQAANRTKVGQWWFERKKILKPVIITAAVVTIVVLLIIELIRIASGA